MFHLLSLFWVYTLIFLQTTSKGHFLFQIWGFPQVLGKIWHSVKSFGGITDIKKEKVEGIIHCQDSNKWSLSYHTWVPRELFSSDVSYKLLASSLYLLNLPQVNTCTGAAPSITEHSDSSYHTKPFPRNTNSIAKHRAQWLDFTCYTTMLPQHMYWTICIWQPAGHTKVLGQNRMMHCYKAAGYGMEWTETPNKPFCYHLLVF